VKQARRWKSSNTKAEATSALAKALQKHHLHFGGGICTVELEPLLLLRNYAICGAKISAVLEKLQLLLVFQLGSDSNAKVKPEEQKQQLRICFSKHNCSLIAPDVQA
jgi:hypothetical protein